MLFLNLALSLPFKRWRRIPSPHGVFPPGPVALGMYRDGATVSLLYSASCHFRGCMSYVMTEAGEERGEEFLRAEEEAVYDALNRHIPSQLNYTHLISSHPISFHRITVSCHLPCRGRTSSALAEAEEEEEYLKDEEAINDA